MINKFLIQLKGLVLWMHYVKNPLQNLQKDIFEQILITKLSNLIYFEVNVLQSFQKFILKLIENQ